MLPICPVITCYSLIKRTAVLRASLYFAIGGDFLGRSKLCPLFIILQFLCKVKLFDDLLVIFLSHLHQISSERIILSSGPFLGTPFHTFLKSGDERDSD